MKNKFRKRVMVLIFCAVLVGSMVLSGCGENNGEKLSNSAPVSQAETVSSAAEKAESSVVVEQSDIDISYDAEKSTKVALNGSSAVVTGSGAKADGSTVTVSAAGTYVLSGKLEGKIVIEAGKDDEVKLVLDNAEISSPDSPAIYASKCGKTILLLNKDTDNILSDGKDYVKSTEDGTDDNDSPNAAVFIQDDLTILGEGNLTVKANSHNGITSKDTLKITSGNISVTAENHCITGKDNLYISGGTIKVSTDGGDGLRSTYSKDDDENKGHVYIENADIDITCANDGIQAEENLVINSGSISIVTGGGSVNNNNSSAKNDFFGGMKNDNSSSSDETKNYKGMKAGANITVTGGTINIDSYDDAVHGNGDVTVSGGKFTIKAGDDAIHADGNLEVKDGEITVESSYEGLEAEVINISGGTIDVTSSDDGINCAGGNDQSGFGGMDGNMKFRNGFGFNQNNGDDQGNMPQMPDGGDQGNMPQMPDGGDQGNMPQMPDGGDQGNMPQMPDGGDQGNMPQMPDGTQQGGMPENSGSTAVLNISGGAIYVNAQGDGLDSNGQLNISGGTIVVNGTTSGGNGIIDHDGSCIVSGGTLIGAGTSDMLEMPGDTSTQNTLAVLFDQNMSAGTPVYVTDSSGKVIAAMSPEKNYGCFILSSAELKNGETYSVYTGGTVSGKSVKGYCADGNISGGNEYCKFTLSDNKVTYVNADGITTYSGMGGGMGGMHRGRPA